MMELTIQNIIKVLPFDNEFKIELLEKYESLQPGQRYDLENLIWDSYYTLYQLKLEENIQLAMAAAVDKKNKLDKDFYKRVRIKTEEQMGESTEKKIDSVDLTEARKAMELIVREMHAAKAQKKH